MDQVVFVTQKVCYSSRQIFRLLAEPSSLCWKRHGWLLVKRGEIAVPDREQCQKLAEATDSAEKEGRFHSCLHRELWSICARIHMCLGRSLSYVQGIKAL